MIEWSHGRIWYQDMPFKVGGIPVGCRMTVIRLNDNKLFIHSPVELTTKLQLELAKLGRVHAVVTPNLRHHMFLSEWWLSYPDAYFIASPGLEQIRTDITFDDALGAYTSPLWRNQLLQTLVRGSDKMEEVVFCDPLSQTLIVGDTLAWLAGSHNPFTNAFGLLCGCYHHPAMPYHWRISFRNKTHLRQSLQEILTWPFDRIILSHGQLIHENGKAQFANAFQWALQPKLPSQ